MGKRCGNCWFTKPLDQFYRGGGKLGRDSYCKACRKLKDRERPHRPRTSPPTAEQSRRWGLQARHGMTVEEYDRMVEDQNGCCAICRTPTKRLFVDHDHHTGKVRGLLCNKCNIALAPLEDDQFCRLAREYLDQHGSDTGQLLPSIREVKSA